MATRIIRWSATVAVAGLAAVDGRMLTTGGRYSLRDAAVLRSPQGSPVGTVDALRFVGDFLRAAGTLDPGRPSLKTGMISGALHPQMEMLGGSYALRGEQMLFTSGVINAVMLGDTPAFPQARFDTVREVTH